MTDRVRALLITPDDDLLTIERVRPGRDTYWVLPGRSLLYVLERGDERQYIYLTRVRTWSADAGDRDGPEFADPARGEYHLQAIPLTARALAAIDLKPGPLAELLLGYLRAGTDLFSLPDLRASTAGQPWTSRARFL